MRLQQEFILSMGPRLSAKPNKDFERICFYVRETGRGIEQRLIKFVQ